MEFGSVLWDTYKCDHSEGKALNNERATYEGYDYAKGNA